MPALPLPPCADAEPGPLSLPLREFAFGSARVVIQETSYAEGGLGWRVWSSARRLCCQLAAEPLLVTGRRVLELGAGVGLCGLLAARMGACEVTLTDALPGLLEQLSRNAALNDALSAGTVRVRRFLWESDCEDALPGAAKKDIVDPSSLLASQLRRLAAPSSAALEADSVFDQLIASDCLYDWGQRRPLPRVISRRLARPDGVALLTVPVRDKTLLDAFVRELSREGLAWSCSPAVPADDAEEAGGKGSDGETAAQRGATAETMEGEVEPLPHVDIRVWWPPQPAPAERAT